MNINEIGLYCKEFRKQILKLSLKEFSEITGINNKNISSFENGRANNIRYLFLYYEMCDTKLLKDMYLTELFKRGSVNG